MNEDVWINSQEDWSDFLSFLNEEKLTMNIQSDRDSEGNYLAKAGSFIVHIPNSYDLPTKEVATPANKYDPLIFGRNSEDFVTNITVDNDEVYIYKSDGTCEVNEYQNWAIGTNWTEGATRLKGDQYYKYILELPEDQWYNLKDNWNPRVWTPRSAPEGYMLRTGMTYYKGMKVQDVSLLSFDIEATGLNPDDPEALVPLVSTTFRDKSGQIEKKIFDIFDYETREDMWWNIEAYIADINPDIILGHNILSYDLPYANKNSPGLKWGKNGSRIIFDKRVSKIRKDASQQYEYNNASIFGREIVDTFFLAIKYDINRELPSYGLKAIEKYYGFVKEDRTWDFNKWPVNKLIEARKVGNLEIWQKFREYCADDSDSPIKIFDIMIPSFFYLCQSIPKSLQQIINEGTGSALDSFMIRAYLQDGKSLPRSSKPEEFEGAISFGIPGNYKNVFSVDFHALYPSIIKAYKLYDKNKDPEGYLLKATEYFTKVRVEYKNKFKETKDPMYDGMQSAAKVVANSIFGFCGANYLLFNSPKLAARITELGRELLNKICEVSTGQSVYEWKKLIKKEKPEEVKNEN